MYDTVYRYYANTADSALMAAFSPLRDRTQSVMSLNHPLIKNTIESIFQAAITRNVNIELPQIHGTIIPDSFIRPIVSEFNETTIEGKDGYFMSVPATQDTKRDYWNIKKVLYTKIDLLQIDSSNLSQKIFGEFDILSSINI